MMEEQIKYILDMSCEHFVAMPSKCKQRAAKEITAHFMEFIEWKDNYVTMTYEGKYYVSATAAMSDMNINETYQYWLTNVKK